ncbi:MAG: UxaA family hydrolase [Desulfitobacterium hafniense]|nr:UxaA family hydrolase [Desulfitobacterium hafniense]
MAKALQIDPRDNVAVVLSDVQAEEEVLVNTESGAVSLKSLSNITFGHKIALKDFEANEAIIKYGEEIGKANAAIQAGEWIHLHNVYCERGRDEK